MSDYLIQQAIKRATGSEVKALNKPKSLPTVKLARLSEKELEKIAPKTGYLSLMVWLKDLFLVIFILLR